MKKILLMFAAALVIGSNASYAQKIDQGVAADLEKWNEAVAHPKKGLKASTWLSRGDAYLKAQQEPTKALFIGIELTTLEVLCGKARPAGEKTFGSKAYKVYEYPFFTAYVQNGKVMSWKSKKDIRAGLADEAIKSYQKAFELDPSVKEKSDKGFKALVDFFKMRGQLAVEVSDMKTGAAAYLRAANIQANEAYNAVEPVVLFYSGYMSTIDGETNPASYEQGEKVLNRAIAAGYDADEDADSNVDDKERGNIYYYLFHCAYAVRESKPAKLAAAKKYLEQGISKYPQNEKIFEGLLQLYTAEKGVGDPAELLETIQKSIERDNDNINAWFGRGRIYFALKDYEMCILSFKEVARIDPKLFDGHYYLGLFYMLRGDEYLETMNANTYTVQAEYNKDIAKLNSLYIDAVPCFEAAHEIKPTDRSTLEYLKQLCFRLRDEPGIMEKYTKYNELFKALPQE